MFFSRTFQCQIAVLSKVRNRSADTWRVLQDGDDSASPTHLKEPRNGDVGMSSPHTRK
jgi:hypothetical protein